MKDPLRLTTHIGRHWIARTVQTGTEDFLTTAAWRHELGRVQILFQYPTHTEDDARRKHKEACTYLETYGASHDKA